MLWHIRRNENTARHDEAAGFVIRADTPKQVRLLAAGDSGDEGTEIWLNSKYTTCSRLNAGGRGRIILRDYRSA